VLFTNAGVLGLPPGQTKDGYEIQFGTNHLGHALLIKLLLPIMLRTAEDPTSDVRIVSLTSTAYRLAPKGGISFDSVKTPQAELGGMIVSGKWVRYGQSKLANMIYAKELAKRYPSIKSVSVHPGYVKTDMVANVSFMLALPLLVAVPLGPGWTPVEKGPYNQIWAGTTDKSNLKNGAYYVPIAKEGSFATARARDSVLAERLWDWTQKELEAFQ